MDVSCGDVWLTLLHLVVAEAWQEEEEQAGDGILEMSDADGNRGLMDGETPRGFPKTNKNM